MLTYLRHFWDSTNKIDGILPQWQSDALNLKQRAQEISKNCKNLSSGNSLRDSCVLENEFINLFWNHERKSENNKSSAKIRKCGACKTEEWKCKLNPCETRQKRLNNKTSMATKPQLKQKRLRL